MAERDKAKQDQVIGHPVRCLALAVVVASLFLGGESAVGDYYYTGSGQWTWTNLKYYSYAASAYTTAFSTAAYNWDLDTDLTLTSVPMDYEDIGAFSGNWGPTIWDGRTIICALSGTCYSSTPINENFNYVEIQFNTYYMDGYAWDRKQAVASHELGHAFSLGHVATCNPHHIMYTPVWSSCNGYIIWEQQHDIDGVNARY